MAQLGFDRLMALTDSRYRLSMIVARRAAQLKMGIPPILGPEDYPKTRNSVSIAMMELAFGSGVVWGDTLPAPEDLRQALERERREEPVAYSVSRQPPAPDEDDTFDDDEDV